MSRFSLTTPKNSHPYLHNFEYVIFSYFIQYNSWNVILPKIINHGVDVYECVCIHVKIYMYTIPSHPWGIRSRCPADA